MYWNWTIWIYDLRKFKSQSWIFKSGKKLIKTKAKNFWYDLREKMKISEITKFSVLPYTQNRKLENLKNLGLEDYH